MRIKKFLDSDMSTFASYRVIQRIPQLIDGLGQTQRKIVYAMLASKTLKRIKVLDTYSLAKKYTQYAHGDNSVYSSAISLAARYKNNLPILQQYGTFGNRTLPISASPRYIEIKISKTSLNIFPESDMDLTYDQTFEGHKIEPRSLLPIIPLAVINGYEGIGLGFSNKVFPREPKKVIQQLKNILLQKTSSLRDLKPSIPHFNGIIEHVEKTKWRFIGKISKHPKLRNVLVIDEVTPNTSRESYLEKLKNLKENKKIKSYSDNCSKNDFYFEVKVDNATANMSQEQLISMFGLSTTAVENFTFLTENLEIQTYNSYSEYLADYIKFRGEYYVKRFNIIC
jgi:DNA topoisomerase-2